MFSLTDKVRFYFAAVVAVVFMVLFAGQAIGRIKAEQALATANQVAKDAKRDLGICQGNAANLKASIDSQNLAVESFKRQAEARVAESRKAAQEAVKEAASYRRNAAEILKAKPASADRCAAARKLIEEYAE